MISLKETLEQARRAVEAGPVQQVLDENFPKLTELEIAVCLEACRKAGAVNAANALSKHIIRLELEAK